MGSHWITADMAYRRSALVEVRGFDERFPRAYREDADLAARVLAAGWQLQHGNRRTVHPLRPQPGWHASVRAQRGNADDALMRRAHGRRWRESSGAGRGRLPWHLATVAAGTTALAAGLGAARVPRRSGGWQRVAAVAGATWLALSSDFALRRIAAGPPQPAEWVRMATTSVLIPPVALWQRLSGRRRHRGASAWPPPVRAVLFDRDGTLVVDVPYNTDPGLVQARPHAREALDLLRCNGIRVGVVTNQSGVGRGTITGADLAAVNGAVEEQLGPFDTWQVCCHTPEAGCACRKPGPALVLAAARELGVRPEECVVVGDIETDLLAARAAGARSVLVPTSETLAREVADAPVVATDLLGAAHLVLEGAL
jgi:histidinol-phosphate phosphatase family protein